MVLPALHSVSCRLRHFAAYGRANKYRPVKNCRASTNTAERPSLFVYLFWVTATPLTITTIVKAIDSQRCVSRIHLFKFNAISSEIVALFGGALVVLPRPSASRKRRPRNSSFQVNESEVQDCSQSKTGGGTRSGYCAAENARGSNTVWIELIFPSLTRYHEQKKVVTLGVMKS